MSAAVQAVSGREVVVGRRKRPDSRCLGAAVPPVWRIKIQTPNRFRIPRYAESQVWKKIQLLSLKCGGGIHAVANNDIYLGE